MLNLALLFCAGLVAGAMNAVAGGGTFAAFPALLAVGLPPTVANATSNAALLPGAAVSAWTYRRILFDFGPLKLRTMFLLTLAGGALGAALLQLTSDNVFRLIVPWLLLLASLALTFAGRLRSALEKARFILSPIGAAALQIALGVYGGYFGGAVGLIMTASWVLISGLSVKDLAGARTLLLAAANLAACVLFVVFGLIAWRFAAPIALGSILGGYVGARVALRLPQIWIRAAILSVTYVTTAVFFWRA